MSSLEGIGPCNDCMYFRYSVSSLEGIGPRNDCMYLGAVCLV